MSPEGSCAPDRQKVSFDITVCEDPDYWEVESTKIGSCGYATVIWKDFAVLITVSDAHASSAEMRYALRQLPYSPRPACLVFSAVRLRFCLCLEEGLSTVARIDLYSSALQHQRCYGYACSGSVMADRPYAFFFFIALRIAGVH